jgi:hypothetical protein
MMIWRKFYENIKALIFVIEDSCPNTPDSGSADLTVTRSWDDDSHRRPLPYQERRS